MYTLEERMKAVELYIQSGCSEGTVIRTLGYPSHTALRNWYKEYLTAGRLRAGSAPNPRYTQEQKQEAVEAMLVQGIPDYKVAAQYGVSRAALYNWKQRLLGRDKVVPMKKKANPVEQSREKESLEAEIADLQQQIYRLQMERDALEKAAEELLKKQAASN